MERSIAEGGRSLCPEGRDYLTIKCEKRKQKECKLYIIYRKRKRSEISGGKWTRAADTEGADDATVARKKCSGSDVYY